MILNISIFSIRHSFFSLYLGMYIFHLINWNFRNPICCIILKFILFVSCDILGKSWVTPLNKCQPFWITSHDSLLMLLIWHSPVGLFFQYSLEISPMEGTQMLLQFLVISTFGLLQFSTAIRSMQQHSVILYSLLSIFFKLAFNLPHYKRKKKENSPYLPECTYHTPFCIMFPLSFLHGLTWPTIPQDTRKACTKSLLSGPPGGAVNSTWLPEWITVTFQTKTKGLPLHWTLN